MIDLTSVVMLVLYILAAGAVFGLLYFLVTFVESQFPGPIMALFAKCAKIGLVVLAVLVLIGIILSAATGTPIIRWGGR